MKKFYLEILGACRLKYGDQIIEDAPRKVWILLECLYINRNRYVSMDELTRILWGKKKMANPANSIKVLVFELRNRIDELGDACGKDMILNINGGYRLSEKYQYSSDAESFENDVLAAEKKPEEREKLLDRALSLYKGNMILMDEECYWQRVIRDHYAELYEKAVSMKRDLLLAKGEKEEARKLCKKAYLTNPLSDLFQSYLEEM